MQRNCHHPTFLKHARATGLGLCLVGCLISPIAGLSAPAENIGVFESASDVGKIALPGSSQFLPKSAQCRITGSGANIWGKEDAFQFLWQKASGDLAFSIDVTWEGEGKEPHRKACAMIRQGLAADAPYVDVAVHGEGLIELQIRKEKGADTIGVRTPIKAPATVKLERDGDVFTASVSKSGGPFQPIGAISLALTDPVYVGLAVCAHNARNSETALISNVTLTNRRAQANEKRVQETSLETIHIETGERKLVYRDRSKFEAPNWSRDGKLFYLNRDGGIWTLPVTGGEPKRLNTGAVDKCNNDHGLSFDGQWLAISSGGGKDGSKIYVLPATGGEPRLVTPNGPSYWHGWSPDGQTLAYCAKRNDNFDIYTIPTAGGAEQRLTTAEGLDDGAEYTADGSKIYFNSERTGVMQIWRMNPDGTAQEQVTTDPNFADWFAHPSPEGKWLVFVSFDKSVKGHPGNQNITLRLMPLAGGKPKIIATLFGGQGTINVPSWSPDSKQIAFVSYRHVLAPTGTVSAAKTKPSNTWQDYPTRLIGSLPDYQPTTESGLSTYGGIRTEGRAATGFFRAEKIGRRWWLIDPEGYRFIHVGVVDVKFPKSSGTPEAWAAATTELLHANGFNGAGAWSDTDLLRASQRPVAYTKIWNFMSEYGRKRGGVYQQAGHMGYPKDCIFVFDPAFVTFCDDYARRLAATKDDPWLLGHFSDNELPFYSKTLDNFLKLSPDDAGRKAVDQWLAERRSQHPDEQGITDQMRDDFLGFVAGRYLQITTAAIRKYDPHHLCLGPRFDFQALQSKALFEAAGRHLDVIAANYYHAWSPDPVRMDNWVQWSGKPFLVTEWYAKAMDSGFANTTGAGWVVKTQADRGKFYQNFTLGLLESGGCVGWHWFKYRDNDPSSKTADPSNLDSNKGIVNLRLEPYAPLLQAMDELNRQVHALAAYFDRRKP
jgi:hypothetical protein